MKVGTRVKVKGLVKAAQHNGKVGKVVKSAAGDGRIGIQLSDGKQLAIKKENIEIVSEVQSATSDIPTQRELKRDNSLLNEFDGSPDPNTLALYYHFADRAFDAYNAQEMIQQIIRYYKHNLQLKLVVPRRIRSNEYYLLCLQHDEHTKNTLCELAFNCGRSFAGIGILVKKRCFNCNRPGAPQCRDCLCACFCSDSCRKSIIGEAHDVLCKQVNVEGVVVEDEVVSLI